MCPILRCPLFAVGVALWVVALWPSWSFEQGAGYTVRTVALGWSRSPVLDWRENKADHDASLTVAFSSSTNVNLISWSMAALLLGGVIFKLSWMCGHCRFPDDSESGTHRPG